ncbi:MAG: DUF5674 family protein [Candidatus Paceibacterota bacterium]|jgi:hypothetical protein|nr:DUF5674 family protein [Candidatus Paceibacterota bacterium]
MILITKDNKISVGELTKMSEKMFGGLVKAVVDVEKGIMAVDAEFHSDEETFLMGSGSKRVGVWGINLHPALFGKDGFIEFDSMINLKSFIGNHTRGVDDQKIKEKIIEIVNNLVIPS